MSRRILVVVNPVAGRRRALRAAVRFLDALREEGARAEEFRTATPGDAGRAAADARGGGFDAVAVVGGDGTINEVLNGLGGSDLPVGVLPTGTANLLARDLAIPFDPEGAARVVARGRARGIDIGEATAAGAPPRRFLCTAGAGFDGEVVKAVAAARRGGLGFRGYLGPLWRTCAGYEFPPLRVTVDGEPAPPATLAILCNTRSYGGIFTLVPGARPDDGALDACLVAARRRVSFFRYAWAAWRGTLPGHRDVATVRGLAIRIESDRPVPVQVDGDPCGETPVEAVLRPAAAKVLVGEG